MIKMAVFVTYTLIANGQPFTIDPFTSGVEYQTMGQCEQAKPQYEKDFMKWSLEARNSDDPEIAGVARNVELSGIILDCLDFGQGAKK